MFSLSIGNIYINFLIGGAKRKTFKLHLSLRLLEIIEKAKLNLVLEIAESSRLLACMKELKGKSIIRVRARCKLPFD